jgi:toluene monooxygenase system ferredoxin subunit
VFERVCTTDDVWEGELMPFDVAGRRIILVNLDQRLRAFDATCPHQEQSLCDGSLEGYVLTCPAHQWQFDVRTGQGVNPTGCRLKSYALKVEALDVFVDIQQAVDEAA